MERFTHPGDFCPNLACPDYGKLKPDKQNVKKSGKTNAGIQRYQCKTCGKTFTATKGTLLFRKRTSAEQILETRALLAEGNRISSLSRAKGIKEDTILQWLREAVQHAEAVSDVLMADFKIKRAQIDALWSYVGRKAQKMTRKNAPKASSGAQRSWTRIVGCE